jgi:PAS domain-containing protein
MGTGLDLYGRKKDGSEFPVDIALGPMPIKDDIVTLAVVRDYTARKLAEEALLESQARATEQNTELKALIEAMPAGVLITHDAECRRITGNSEGMEIIGEIEGQNLYQGDHQPVYD